MKNADELAKEILGPAYGGPSISFENGKFIVYNWGDAPVSTDTIGSGETIQSALEDVLQRRNKKRRKR